MSRAIKWRELSGKQAWNILLEHTRHVMSAMSPLLVREWWHAKTTIRDLLYERGVGLYFCAPSTGKWNERGVVYETVQRALRRSSMRRRLAPRKLKSGPLFAHICTCSACGVSVIYDGNHSIASAIVSKKLDRPIEVIETIGHPWPAGVLDMARVCKCRWTRKWWVPSPPYHEEK